MRKRKHLGAVGEGHGTLTWRVERVKDVDEEGDEWEPRAIVFVQPEAEASGQEGPEHVYQVSVNESHNDRMSSDGSEPFTYSDR
jgi:hypothetical protein